MTRKKIDTMFLVDSQFQDRQTYPEDTIRALAQTIAEVGLLHPITVREVEEKYEIITGHRRSRAIKLLGWKDVTVELVTMSDDQVQEVQLIENLQREGVHPIEESESFRRLLDRGLAAADIARRIGQNIGYVHSRLRLTALSPTARVLALSDTLTIDAAYVLARVDHGIQDAILKELERPDDPDRQIMLGDVTWKLKRHLRVLDGVGFPLDEPVGDTVACIHCPKRDVAQTSLFDDGLSARYDNTPQCTDPACYDEKLSASWKTIAENYKNQGYTVLAAKKPKFEKKPIFDGESVNIASGLVKRDGTHHTGSRSFNVAEVMADAPPEAFIVARDDFGKPHVLCRATDAVKRFQSSTATKAKRVLPSEPDALLEVLSTEEKARREKEEVKMAREISGRVRAALFESATNGETTDTIVDALVCGLGAILERTHAPVVASCWKDKEAMAAALNQCESVQEVIPFLASIVAGMIYEEGERDLRMGYALAFAETLGLPVATMRAEIEAPIVEKRAKREKSAERKIEKAKKALEAGDETPAAEATA